MKTCLVISVRVALVAMNAAYPWTCCNINDKYCHSLEWPDPNFSGSNILCIIIARSIVGLVAPGSNIHCRIHTLYQGAGKHHMGEWRFWPK